MVVAKMIGSSLLIGLVGTLIGNALDLPIIVTFLAISAGGLANGYLWAKYGAL